MFLPILESLMGTAYSAEELGLCTHGHACRAGSWGRYIGFCLGYGHIGQKSKVIRPAKMFCEAHNFVPCDFLTNGRLYVKRGTLEMRIAVLRE
jgi:hypothetical protein